MVRVWFRVRFRANCGARVRLGFRYHIRFENINIKVFMDHTRNT